MAPHIRPICIVLNQSLVNQMRNVSTFKAFGWGFLRGRKETDILQTITLNNFDRKKCEVDLSVYLSEKQLCAGVPFGDTCEGDSGGPLTNNVNISELGNREVQFGIISAGKITCDGLGMYVDVMSYADWIKTTIERHYTEDEPQSSLVPKIKPQQQDVFLYNDCGGANIAANLEADIYGLNLRAQGIFITHLDQQRAASTPPFTMFFDAPTHRRIYDVSVALGNPQQCSERIQRRVEWNKLCVEPPNGMSRIGSGSYILGKKVTNSGKIMLVLFGIVSDSSNGLYVFTNVMKLSEWIANAIRIN
ncbi:GM15601 [Drosophila sechellia]|uniref:GM15601 n=1 Tax=Drosophila sechellia TaxID=7238 RepID=B4I8D7_DROSE|nr:GM15601 [Drosophila sechellia]